MAIPNVGGIGAGLDASSLGSLGKVSGAPTDPGAATGNSFAQMLDALSGVSTEADSAVADLATGGDRDLHDVVMSVEMESLAFDLAVQIRNRLVDAYSEVFRMQV